MHVYMNRKDFMKIGKIKHLFRYKCNKIMVNIPACKM